MKGNHFNFNHITQCRTTNAAEGFHSALKKDPRHLKHPTVLNVLNFLQSITSEQDERIRSNHTKKAKAKIPKVG